MAVEAIGVDEIILVGERRREGCIKLWGILVFMGGAEEEFAEDPQKRQVRGRRLGVGGYPVVKGREHFQKGWWSQQVKAVEKSSEVKPEMSISLAL